MRMSIIFILIATTLLSCKKQESDIVETEFNYWIEIESGEEIIYFQYPRGEDNAYYTLNYESYSLSRVFWESSDSFATPVPSNPDYKTAVINYSTYTREDGTGNQNVYIGPEMIGDTLRIYGYILEPLVDPNKVLAQDYLEIIVR